MKDTFTLEGEYDPIDWYGKVRIDGTVLSPKKSQRVRNHSPDGFAWGYGGSGPAQLALAVCLTHLSEDDALLVYQDFKWEFVAQLPRARFSITVPFAAWLATKKLQGRAL